MKRSEKLVNNYGLVAGVISIATAFLIFIFILLAEIGCIFPRKIAITVTTLDAKKEYDATELTGDFYLPEDRLIEGHHVEVIFKSSITEIGETDNKVELVIKDSTDADVTDRYDISYDIGKLTVTPRQLALRSKSASKIYDGTPFEYREFDIVTGKLIDGHKVTVNNCVQYTAPGQYKNDMSFRIFDESGNDVTECYDMSFIQGQLDINGIKLKILTGSVSQTYDGSPVSNSEWSILSGALDNGDTLTATEFTEFDGVGTVDNVIKFRVTDTNGVDVSEKYEIDYTYGKLKVSPINISIEMGSVTSKYTGKPISCNKYTITSGKLCDGHTLTVVGKTRTDVGISYNDLLSYTIMATMPNGTKKDVSNCYMISYTSGTIKVTTK